MPRLFAKVSPKKNPKEIVAEFLLTFLSQEHTAKERAAFKESCITYMNTIIGSLVYDPKSEGSYFRAASEGVTPFLPSFQSYIMSKNFTLTRYIKILTKDDKYTYQLRSRGKYTDEKDIPGLETPYHKRHAACLGHRA